MQIVARQARQVYNPCAYHRLTAENRVVNRADFIKQVPLFAGLDNAELAALAQDLWQRRFMPGEAIFQQGDSGQMLYLIESGQVRIYVQDEEGQETSVNLCGPGEMFGELALIDEMPRSASVVAMEPTVVYIISRERFREHLLRSPQLALNFMKMLTVRVRYTTQQLSSLTLLDTPGRLARKLLELAQDHGQVEAEGVRINLSLTQSDLASLIGTTRESVNKAMGAFRRQGLILMKEGHIVIVDADKLRELGL